MDNQTETEIRHLIDRMIDGLNRGDTARFGSIFSGQAGDVVIGTDPDEWVAIPDLLAVHQQGAAEAGELNMKTELDELSVHSVGDVAWVEGKARFVSESRGERPFRLTALFLREAGEWKARQTHASVGVPNSELFSG